MIVYKIQLNDGTVIDGLRMNGTCFVSLKKLNKDVFRPTNLKGVKIENEDSGEVKVYSSMDLAFFIAGNSDTSFSLIQSPDPDENSFSVGARLGFLSLMTNVDMNSVYPITTEKIKCWFELGFWTTSMLRDLVRSGKMTSAEYKEIAGVNFDA